MVKHYCDRCGREINPLANRVDTKPTGWQKDAPSFDSYELCDACFHEFEGWMKKETET